MRAEPLPNERTRRDHAVPALPRVLGALVDRIDVSRPEPQLLVVTADAEGAAAAASAIVGMAGTRGVRVLAATMSPRAARLRRSGAAGARRRAIDAARHGWTAGSHRASVPLR
jgi:hypothetical protein